MKKCAAFLFLALVCVSLRAEVVVDEFHDLSISTQEMKKILELAREKKLAQSAQWIRLVHYKKVWGVYESQADGPTFFLSPLGKDNPEKELEGTLLGFFRNIKIQNLEKDQHPRCQFPARLKWLTGELGLDPSRMAPADCRRFEDFKMRAAAQSATLVFSSFYLNNPSSTFGHTLLRLNKAKSALTGKRHELLDYGINYAASATVSNPLLYGLYGFAGLFPGNFSSIPYFYKVREYNGYESRDLWEYDLNLTPDEIDMLVRHIWELGSTYFDYYYLTENCSYHLFTLLDAAVPRVDLARKLAYYVIPSDTVKILWREPGLVSAVHYRPSVRSEFFERVKKLDDDGVDRLEEITKFKPGGFAKSLEGLDSVKKMRVLDAALDFVDFRHSKELLVEDPLWMDRKRELLVARSEIASFEPLEVPPPKLEAPHEGHDSTRIGLLHEQRQNRLSSLGFDLRFALHDLNDPVVGYPEYGQIEFLHFGGSYFQDTNKLLMNQADLLSLTSLSGLSTFYSDPSWRARIGSGRVNDERCFGCYAALAQVGGGLSFTLLPRKLLVFALADGEASASSDFVSGNWRLGVGPSVGARISFGPNFNTTVEAGYRRYYLSEETENRYLKLTSRYGFLSKYSVGINALWDRFDREVSAGFYWYF